MYWRLFAKPIAWLALAAYLSYWVGSAEQLNVSAAIRPVIDSIARNIAYLGAALLALSAFGFMNAGYRIWRWQRGEIPFCPRCGSMMEIRTGRYGEFWGCMSFPRCRGSEDI